MDMFAHVCVMIKPLTLQAVDILEKIYGTREPRHANVSQQLPRMGVDTAKMQCITPSGQIYLLHEGRCLGGLIVESGV